MSTQKSIRIGGASGFWGDASLATPQLLAGAELDYIVYDYLAEVTLSIMARARAADSTKGYATDFVSAAMAPNLAAIAEQGVKVVANAGGVNPEACGAAIRDLVAAQNLSLSVAVVKGDDLMPRVSEFADAEEMFSGDAFPPLDKIASMNAYLGAFPIAAALAAGADIVVTGRCVDSAVTLGACIHAFEWEREQLDLLAQGSLAGHILECGTQATGGNFTDWESLGDSLGNAGYPIADIEADGAFTLSKPAGTGGAVTVGTVGEQMLYEIGDPRAYILPDVVCDFTGVAITQSAEDRVRVEGAKGRGIPPSYKVSTTWADGFRAGQIWGMVGRDAAGKAEHFAQSVFARTNTLLDGQGLPPLTETSVEVLGVESHYGAAAEVSNAREVDFKLAAKHPSPKGVGVFLKEMVGLALTGPPGLASFAGARPKPMPVVRLFSMLIPKEQVSVSVELDAKEIPYVEQVDLNGIGTPVSAETTGNESFSRLSARDLAADLVEVPLELLAWGRSGDKGDKANIGIIARRAEFLPWIAEVLTEQYVAEFFAHFLEPGQAQPVDRFYLHGSSALNFLLHAVLGGGGVASLRSDPQGKGYAQLLLTEAIPIPRTLAKAHGLDVMDTD